MSTKSRRTIYGGAIMGADIRAKSAREAAEKAIRAADRAEAEAWSIRMEGYGGPAQPSSTISQCLSGGLGWLEIECNRCKTRASIPPRCHPPATGYADLETGRIVPMPFVRHATLQATGTYDQVDRNPQDHAL